jgi:hypothetical protein
VTCPATLASGQTQSGSTLSSSAELWRAALTPSNTAGPETIPSSQPGTPSTSSGGSLADERDRYAAALLAIIAKAEEFDPTGTHQQSGLAVAARIAREALGSSDAELARMDRIMTGTSFQREDGTRIDPAEVFFGGE